VTQVQCDYLNLSTITETAPKSTTGVGGEKGDHTPVIAKISMAHCHIMMMCYMSHLPEMLVEIQAP
jgi:hypothetical protein